MDRLPSGGHPGRIRPGFDLEDWFGWLEHVCRTVAHFYSTPIPTVHVMELPELMAHYDDIPNVHRVFNGD